MIGISFALIAISSSWVAHRIGMPWLNGISVFTLIWAAIVIVADIPGFLEPRIGTATWMMIGLAFVAIIIGTTFGWFVAKPKQVAKGRATIRRSRLLVVHSVCVVAYAGSFAIQFFEILPLIIRTGGLTAVFSSSGNAFRRAGIEASIESVQGTFDSGSLLLGLVGYVLYLVGGLAIFSGAVLWNARSRLRATLPLLLAGVFSLLTLQRTTVVAAVILFLTGVQAVRWSGVTVTDEQRSRRPSVVSNRRLGTMAIAAFGSIGLLAAILIPLQARNGNTSNPTGGASLLVYVFSGISGLNARNISNSDWMPPPGDVPGTWDPAPGWGAYTFRGLFQILHRAQVPVPVSRVNLDYYPVSIARYQTSSNVGTALTNFYLDFGWLGILLIPLVLGILVGAAQRRVRNGNSLILVPFVAYLLTVIAWMFFVSWLGDFRLTLLGVFGGPALWYLLMPGRHPAAAGQTAWRGPEDGPRYAYDLRT